MYLWLGSNEVGTKRRWCLLFTCQERTLRRHCRDNNVLYHVCIWLALMITYSSKIMEEPVTRLEIYIPFIYNCPTYSFQIVPSQLFWTALWSTMLSRWLKLKMYLTALTCSKNLSSIFAYTIHTGETAILLPTAFTGGG